MPSLPDLSRNILAASRTHGAHEGSIVEDDMTQGVAMMPQCSGYPKKMTR